MHGFEISTRHQTLTINTNPNPNSSFFGDNFEDGSFIFGGSFVFIGSGSGKGALRPVRVCV